MRSNRPEVRNPVLALPAAARLRALDAPMREALRAVLLDIREDARGRAETCWRRHKAPMAAYWKAVSVYAGHLARAVKWDIAPPAGALVQRDCIDLRAENARLQAEVERLRERLEIVHAFDMNGNRMPHPIGEIGSLDGIACRDESIKQLRAQLARADALLLAVAEAVKDAALREVRAFVWWTGSALRNAEKIEAGLRSIDPAAIVARVRENQRGNIVS